MITNALRFLLTLNFPTDADSIGTYSRLIKYFKIAINNAITVLYYERSAKRGAKFFLKGVIRPFELKKKIDLFYYLIDAGDFFYYNDTH